MSNNRTVVCGISIKSSSLVSHVRVPDDDVMMVLPVNTCRFPMNNNRRCERRPTIPLALLSGRQSYSSLLRYEQSCAELFSGASWMNESGVNKYRLPRRNHDNQQ